MKFILYKKFKKNLNIFFRRSSLCMIVLGQQMTIEALHPLTSNTKLLKEAMTKGKQFETKCTQLI